MAAYYGQGNTYASNNNLGNLKISIEDQVGKYPAKKFPVLRRLTSKIFYKEVDNPLYQWKEEVLRPTRDLLGASVSSTTATTVVATTPGVYNVDDVIKVDSEYMIVTAVAGDGITLTVVRGWNTTAATHTTSSSEYIYRVGVAAPEGADADGPVIQPVSNLQNYTEIFEDVVQMSGTEEESWLYRTDEGGDNVSNQIAIKQQELMEMLQTSILVGTSHDDGVSRRTMGGLKYFIDQYASANAIDLGGYSNWSTQSTDIPSTVTTMYTVAQQKLDDLIEQIVYQRGTPTAIYAGYKSLRHMATWGIDAVRTDRGDKEKGYAIPRTYLSQAGDLDVVMVPGDALSDLIFVVDETRAGFKAYKNRGWSAERLAKTGDSVKYQVLGEYTMKVQTPLVHGYLYDLGLISNN